MKGTKSRGHEMPSLCLAILVFAYCNTEVARSFSTTTWTNDKIRTFSSTAVVSSRLSLSVHPSSAWSVSARLARDVARSKMEELLPSQQYSVRIGLGRQAQGIGGDSVSTMQPMSPDDPRLAMTYAEFPLQSFDALLDVALTHLPDSIAGMQMVDIGSGMGRIVLYAALTRGVEEQSPWHVHGVEISSTLHQHAVVLAQEGAKRGVFVRSSHNQQNSFSFHEGRVQDYQDSILGNADVVFAYSTAFNAKNFDPEVGAMILDAEWSETLGNACRPGCVAITTDRVLDPRCGWRLLDRIDVENPEVFGSTGYIHVLESRT